MTVHSRCQRRPKMIESVNVSVRQEKGRNVAKKLRVCSTFIQLVVK